MSRFNGVNTRMAKHDRERLRIEKREQKALRLAERRQAKLKGVEIDSLPSQMQGLARTLANGEGTVARLS